MKTKGLSGTALMFYSISPHCESDRALFSLVGVLSMINVLRHKFHSRLFVH